MLACRTYAKCEVAATRMAVLTATSDTGITPGRVTPMECDLSSLSSVEAFVRSWNIAATATSSSATQGGVAPQLDILVLNAAVFHTPYTLSADGIELQFATNHLGHFYLMQQLLGNFPFADQEVRHGEAGTGRVVVVGSNSHFITYNEGDLF